MTPRFPAQRACLCLPSGNKYKENKSGEEYQEFFIGKIQLDMPIDSLMEMMSRQVDKCQDLRGSIPSWMEGVMDSGQLCCYYCLFEESFWSISA